MERLGRAPSLNLGDLFAVLRAIGRCLLETLEVVLVVGVDVICEGASTILFLESPTLLTVADEARAAVDVAAAILCRVEAGMDIVEM